MSSGAVAAWAEAVARPVVETIQSKHAVRVSLSSGDVFWIDADLDDVAEAFGRGPALMRVGARRVNPTQVVQLVVTPVSSTETPERLED